jgi:hypothetical protein
MCQQGLNEAGCDVCDVLGVFWMVVVHANYDCIDLGKL